MNHHAFFVAGDIEEGIKSALAFGERELDLSLTGNPDVIVLRYALFSVDDARRVAEIASRTSAKEGARLIIIAAPRLFHEAQNVLLKTFEEPPAGTYLVIATQSEGAIIPTLRSRLIALPNAGEAELPENVTTFLKGSAAEREKIVTKLLDRAKSDKPEEKQAARAEALAFANGLAKAAYPKRSDPATLAFLSDLDRFIPILHERSAPLKPIFEHLLITIPAGIGR